MAVSKEFDIERLKTLFNDCQEGNDGLDMDSYISAYDEISKLIRSLGIVFAFVSSSIKRQLTILREYRTSEEREEYKTIESMASYEVENNIIDNTERVSGSFALLTLHRALHFILEFMKKLYESDNSVKVSCLASLVYDETLARFHPRVMQKGVHVAVYTLPNRNNLFRKIKVGDEHAFGLFCEIIDLGQFIYEKTEEIYSDNNLLDLT